jgi:hypothetical protein
MRGAQLLANESPCIPDQWLPGGTFTESLYGRLRDALAWIVRLRRNSYSR